MQLLQQDGVKKSITIKGLRDWDWSPKSNILIYTAFFDETENIEPHVGFMKIPFRQVIETAVCKGSEELKMYLHPQGNYLAVYNNFKQKKSLKHTIEVFDFTGGDMIPRQQIVIKRDVQEFNGLYWEPFQNKLAVHTKSRKE